MYIYLHHNYKQTEKHMKKIIIISALALGLGTISLMAQKAATPKAAPISATGKWNVDPAHSFVKFSVEHMVISEVEGNFKTFSGAVESPSADFSNAKINFNVDVNSINTDNEGRDKHLKGDDFFNAEKFPQMSFASTSFKKVKGNIYAAEGNLTIRDVTKKVKFAVVYGGVVKDPWGNIKAGFKAAGSINRKEYGLKWSAVTEAGGAVVGDDIKIQVNVELAQQKA